MQSIAPAKRRLEARAEVCLRDVTTYLLSSLVAESLRDPQHHAVVTPEEFIAARARGSCVRLTDTAPVHERPVGVAAPDGLFEVSTNSCRLLSIDDFRARLSGANKFRALAITGHGAEHVIRVGEAWLSASATGYGLAGDVIQPDELEVPLVLLNGCSTLRLAGSVVPLEHSLAARLAARGTTVLGPFRNVRGSERVARAFVRAFLSGKPVAWIAHHLNLLLRDEEGELPCIAVLGDPGYALFSGDTGQWRMIKRLPPATPCVLGHLELETRTARRLLDLLTDLAAWDWPLERAQAASRRTWAAMQAARGALAAAAVDMLSADDYALLQTRLAEGNASLLKAIQQDASDWIGGGRWLQGAYAPVRYRKIDRRFLCDGTCGQVGNQPAATVVDYRYDDPANTAATAYARECDRCGSKSEWAGAMRLHESPRCRVVAPQKITLSLPTLPDEASGCVLIHRDRRHAPLPWPAKGGPVEIDLSRSCVTGRVTIVALSIAPAGLATQYTNLFRDPDTKTVTEAEMEMAG